MNSNIVAIVVTYNRLELLKENIASLLAQTQRLDILLIDNASTDGTREYVTGMHNPYIIYENTGKNLGGSGGFSWGIRRATELGYTYGWIMDDDSIPEPTALEKVLDVADRCKNFSFLSSVVYWSDGTIFPMNRPTMERMSNEHIDAVRHNKVIPIESASFVGCFLPLRLVKSVGLPIAEFFIYGDDVEYTQRLRKEGPAYWIIDSEIVHKAPSKIGADLITADTDRIGRFYYQMRNGVYLAKKSDKTKEKLKMAAFYFSKVIGVIRYSERSKFKRIYIATKGIIDGLRFNPEIKFLGGRKAE